MGVEKAAAPGRDAVDVRRLRVFRAVAGDITVADVVGEDDDDVGLGSLEQGAWSKEPEEDEVFHGVVSICFNAATMRWPRPTPH